MSLLSRMILGKDPAFRKATVARYKAGSWIFGPPTAEKTRPAGNPTVPLHQSNQLEPGRGTPGSFPTLKRIALNSSVGACDGIVPLPYLDAYSFKERKRKVGGREQE